ncbi:DNA repair protein rad2 [Saitoella coloradoensis]
MGVTGLWTVLEPCARPVRLDQLAKKRLAVDASIWVYQFLKAVRDKSGNQLRNSHIVGFFRRICKLLFFGIKPVFVFDGGAPVLKRQTIANRLKRREGRREDAVRTAGKLLALRMKQKALEDKHRDKAALNPTNEGGDEIPEDVVYYGEPQYAPQNNPKPAAPTKSGPLGNTPALGNLQRDFRKKDAYDLPRLDVPLEDLASQADPRIMTQEDLEEYARQFEGGEDITLYDFSKIDFDGEFFTSLPVADQYNIINAARLRSRLRMGLAKEQLSEMFPNRLEFSKFQIERVKERNDLTQRLFNINGMNEVGARRIASERGREYMLVKNEGAEGGYALGVREGGADKPVVVDPSSPVIAPTQETDSEDDGAFEDVPIPGVNMPPPLRAPSPPRRERPHFRPTRPKRREQPAQRDKALFQAVGDERNENEEYGNENDDVEMALAMSMEEARGDERGDDDLQRAINASLQEQNVLAARPMQEAIMLEDDSDYEDEQRAIAMSLKNTNDVEPSRPAAEERGLALIMEDDSDDGVEGEQAPGGFLTEGEQPKPKEPELPPWFSAAEGVADKVNSEHTSEAVAKEPNEQQEEGEAAPLPFVPMQSLLKKKAPAVSAPASNAKLLFDDPAPEASNVKGSGFGPSLLKRQQAGPSIVFDEPEPAKTGEPEVVDLSSPPPEVTVPDSQPLHKFPSDAIQLDDEDRAATPTPRQKIQPQAITLDADDVDDEDGDVTLQPEAIADAAKVLHGSPPPPMADTDQFAEYVRAQPPPPEKQLSPLPNAIEDGHASMAEQVPEEADNVIPWSPSPELPQMEETGQEALGADTSAGLVGEDQFFSDDEDEQLMMQLAQEAEEHARFTNELRGPASEPQTNEDFERELRQLRNQQKKDRRDADEVTQVMIKECQELLRHFGLPYVTAPMEAEAQCAALVEMGLVDGVVTDDSDVLLFGGTRIYKNMFNQAKYVECYLMDDLKREYNLDREKLIKLAHLLGSDYTEGLPSVGPVTALELLADFEKDGGLKGFKRWWLDVQRGKDVDSTTPFRRKFKKNAHKIFLGTSFPDPRIDEAYLQPEVDKDPQPFEWGVPDLDALRSFLMSTIGWSQERTDEVLVPVIRDMNRKQAEGTQVNLTHFFDGSTGAGAAPRERYIFKSKRLQNAMTSFRRGKTPAGEADEGSGTSSEEEANASNGRSKAASKKGKGKRKRAEPEESEVQIKTEADDELPVAQPVTKKRAPAKVDVESSSDDDNASRGMSLAASRGTGRAKVAPRGRGRGRGKGRAK